MAYKIVLDKNVEKNLDRLEKRNRYFFRRIIEGINNLSSHPFSGKSLVGDKKGYFSLRVGDYRIIYAINHTQQVIQILDISHRREVYR